MLRFDFVNARVRQLLDDLLQLPPEDRALVAAAMKRVVKDHDAILAKLAK